eukprot:TRINITY_DN6807_c0_g1_i15.p1 TRINITY_DN6807_c0_g1~~TRINITY_DN6807_c0_g1_i15.p1  ORF type:complete len:227 (-),score=31.69 TRINITY_DN6807_c0_g1_i15:224-904(-)
MHDLESLMKFFSKSIMYLDPFVPKGCFGASQLQKHLSMFFTNHPETNLTAGDIFATEGNQYIVRARLTRPRHNVKVWVMLLIVFDDDQESQDLSIKQCELYFDTAVLFGRGVVEENTAGNDFTDLDLVFTKTFQLPSLQHVFVEEAVVSTQSTGVNFHATSVVLSGLFTLCLGFMLDKWALSHCCPSFGGWSGDNEFFLGMRVRQSTEVELGLSCNLFCSDSSHMG